MKFDYVQFNIAGHFAPAIINGDQSGLSNADCAKLSQFLAQECIKDFPGHWDGFAEEDSTGFSRDDVTGLLADCYSARYYFPDENAQPPQFDRFDIAEAWYFALSHCHAGQWSREYARLCKLGRKFKPGRSASVATLNKNARLIYEAACAKMLSSRKGAQP